MTGGDAARDDERGFREVRRPLVDCCGEHARTCEPYDACCPLCPEYAHDFEGFTTGTHRDGTPCAAPDLTQPIGAQR